MMRRRGTAPHVVRTALVLLSLAGAVVVFGPSPAAAHGPDTGAVCFPDQTECGAYWHSPGHQLAFQRCMEVVDWVAAGHSPGANPPYKHGIGAQPEEPQEFKDHYADDSGAGEDAWKSAVNWGYEGWTRTGRAATGTAVGAKPEFRYRPRCHELLPTNYHMAVPETAKSDAYNWCRDIVEGRARGWEDEEDPLANDDLLDWTRGEVPLGWEQDWKLRNRPVEVPIWYWQLSMVADDCYLLLPPEAFGLESIGTTWRNTASSSVGERPSGDIDRQTQQAYEMCWMVVQENFAYDFGGDRNRGLSNLHGEAPADTVPRAIWVAALNLDGNLAENWDPDCLGLLRAYSCDPDSDRLLPEPCWGAHPSDAYDIGYRNREGDDGDDEGFSADPGVVVDSTRRHMWGGSTALIFSIGRGAIQVAQWTLDYAFTFDIRRFNPLSLGIADSYQTNILGRNELQLADLLWLMLFGWAGWMALRGHITMAGTEILITIVLVALSAVFMANRETYLNATWDLMDETATALLVAGTDDLEDIRPESGGERDQGAEDDDEGHNAITRTQAVLHYAFVEEPYDYLNWGTSLGDPDDQDNELRDCAATRSHILSRGPQGTDDWPRIQMRRQGCDEQADFNQEPTPARFLGAVFVMVSSLLVAVLIGLLSLTVIAAKLVTLLLFALAPFAMMVAVAPGYGRRLTWKWLLSVVQMVVVVIAMTFVLSVLLIALVRLTQFTGDIRPYERFALMNIFVFVAFIGRRNLLRGSQTFAARVAEYMSSPRSLGSTGGGAGGMGWATAGAMSRGSGLDMSKGDKPLAYPAVALGRSTANRWRERRIKNRAYRNLKKVSHWKRRKNYRYERTWGRRLNDRKLGAKRWT